MRAREGVLPLMRRKVNIVISLAKHDGVITFKLDVGTLPPHPWQLTHSLTHSPPTDVCLFIISLDMIDRVLSAIADVETLPPHP